MSGPHAAAPAKELYYATLPEFVDDLLAPTLGRDLSTGRITWCAQWWRHPEGIYRLEALWRSWEHLRRDPATGASVWLLNHMGVLMDPQGPFKGCAAGLRTVTSPCPPNPPQRRSSTVPPLPGAIDRLPFPGAV
ncbi:MAG: DUF4913 domain-containing protein [Actinomycetota bacterium]|nr:DUF4913 domain-containing protein [Actinomycetota bacterium]